MSGGGVETVLSSLLAGTDSVASPAAAGRLPRLLGARETATLVLSCRAIRPANQCPAFRSCCHRTSRVSPHISPGRERNGNRNREVVQRRQGLRVHLAR